MKIVLRPNGWDVTESFVEQSAHGIRMMQRIFTRTKMATQISGVQEIYATMLTNTIANF